MKRAEQTKALVQAVYALCMGGSEVLAQRLAGTLNRTGRYKCSIYAVDHGGPMADLLAAESIPYRVFSRKGKIDVRLILQLAKQLRLDNAQVVHTHHLCELMYAGVAGWLIGAKVIHTEHEYYSFTRHKTRRLLRFLSGIADKVTGVTSEVTDFLRNDVGIPAAKLATIPNGIDIKRFRSARPIDRSEFGWTETDFVIACVARLELEKGHSILLDAFRKLHSRYEHTRLLIIGEGSQIDNLTNISQELGFNGSVRFLGARSDVPELLASCNVVTLASSREGLPMALLEAMAAGKPTVATRVGSVPSLLENGGTGLLVRPGDSRELTEALENLIIDGGKREELVSRGFKQIQQRHSLEAVVSQYEAIYESSLNRMVYRGRRNTGVFV